MERRDILVTNCFAASASLFRFDSLVDKYLLILPHFPPFFPSSNLIPSTLAVQRRPYISTYV